MDREGILFVLEEIGARNVLPHGTNVQLSCPLARWTDDHKNDYDGTPSMGIRVNNRSESLVHCFACQYGGTLQMLVEKLHQLGDKDLTQLVAKVSDMEQADPEWLVSTIEDWEAPRGVYEEKVISEKEIASMLGSTHPSLLRSRKLEIKTIKAWDGGFDREKKRTVFPVRNRDGVLVGMVGRAIGGRQKPKYLNYFDFDKGRYLYGEHLFREGTSVIVCEGLLDVLATWQALAHADRLGTYSVVAFLGSIATKHQLKKLVRMTDEVVLFLDNDPAGWSGQMGAARYLGTKVRVMAVRYPASVGGDPGSLLVDGEDLVSLIENSELMLAS